MFTACTDQARFEGAPAADALEELARVREAFRQESARACQACSDSVIEEMARRLPTRAEDLDAIPGVGQRFAERYGEAFLEVTRRYAAERSGATGLRCEIAESLRRLEKNLTDLGRGNRMLFQPRMYRTGSIDVLDIRGADVLATLFRGGSFDTGDSDEAVRRHVTEIVREANREYRDRGGFDLYLAYPFVEGRLCDGFPVRAPLALFPVEVRREKGIVSVAVDGSRDPIFNSTLVLANMKASGEDGPLPDPIIEDMSEDGFAERLTRFYAEAGMRLSWTDLGPAPFCGGDADRMPHYSDGELKAMPFAVLGRYPLYSSCVQRDFNSILSGSLVSGILDRMAGAPRSVPDMPERRIRERDVMCANPLDSAQERIIAALEDSDGLVIQGPPGTGKSQVIAEVVTSAAVRGMNVLVVSEKKTALDVVLSRLGSLSRYCMLIDDAGDKDSFYSRLSSMLSADAPCDVPDLGAATEEAERSIGALDDISASVYEERESGMLPIRLYSEDLERRTSGRAVPQVLEENVAARARRLEYSEAAEMHRLFSDPGSAQAYLRYRRAAREHPVLMAMKDGLTAKDLKDLEADLDRTSRLWREWSSGIRTMDRMALEKEAYSVLGRYFDGLGRDVLGAVLRNPEDVVAALPSYGDYSEGSRMFGGLEPAWKSYGNGMLEVSAELGTGLTDAEAGMFRLVEAEQAAMFDETFDPSGMESFEDSLARAEAAMSAKREAVRGLAESRLQEALGRIRGSRRFGDMSRIASSRRRWSPGRFVRRFGYEMLGGVRVWLMTPEAVSEALPLEAGMFDLLVFDEASQMFLERGVPAMQRARRIVVAGDHMQLRPSAVGFARYEDSEGGSLLDSARSRFRSFMLDHHYRSLRSELIAFSNRAFYDGRLRVAPDPGLTGTPPIEVRVTDGVWEDRRNRKEAEETVKVLKELLGGDDTVGVITFNSYQRDLVTDLLEEECASDPAFGRKVSREVRRKRGGEDVGLFVKNVESVQGDERDVIVFSVGYGRDAEGRFAQRFGWLNAEGGENRLNVAVTRARRRMIVIRSFDPAEIRSDAGGPGLFKAFLRYADAVWSGDSDGAARILDSVGPAAPERRSCGMCAAASLAESALRRAGFGVERDVGAEGCVLDLVAVRDGRRVLGIEVDEGLYASDPDSRTRDCLRRRYLESRGWRTVRLWIPMMWRDPEKECARIVKEAESASARVINV